MALNFTPYFVAGMISGAGLALFLMFLVSIAFPNAGLTGYLRVAVGGLGLVLLVWGGLLNSGVWQKTKDPIDD